MRAFFYGVIGTLVIFIFSGLLENMSYDAIHKQIIIQTIIICGCTGAIVSAIKSKEENTENEEDRDKKTE